MLALAVGRAAAAQAAVADLGLERRAAPGVQGVGGQHVVVAVHEHVGAPGAGAAEDQRPAGGPATRLASRPAAADQVAGVAGRGGHPLAGGAHAGVRTHGQALHERVPVVVDVGEHVVQAVRAGPAHGVLGSSQRLVMSGRPARG